MVRKSVTKLAMKHVFMVAAQIFPTTIAFVTSVGLDLIAQSIATAIIIQLASMALEFVMSVEVS